MSSDANAATDEAPPPPPPPPPPLSSSPPPPPPSSEQKHMWIITGPAGCGKTSVAEHLRDVFHLPYLEGDSYHTPANVQKMADGQPLNDADRWDWLITLREEAVAALLARPAWPARHAGVILTCSALKRKYRDVLRVAAYNHPEIRLHFVFLSASEAALTERVRARRNHYMKGYMVRSQVESLQAPAEDEKDVFAVDADGTSEEVKRLARVAVESILK